MLSRPPQQRQRRGLPRPVRISLDVLRARYDYERAVELKCSAFSLMRYLYYRPPLDVFFGFEVGIIVKCLHIVLRHVIRDFHVLLLVLTLFRCDRNCFFFH